MATEQTPKPDPDAALKARLAALSPNQIAQATRRAITLRARLEKLDPATIAAAHARALQLKERVESTPPTPEEVDQIRDQLHAIYVMPEFRHHNQALLDQAHRHEARLSLAFGLPYEDSTQPIIDAEKLHKRLLPTNLTAVGITYDIMSSSVRNNAPDLIEEVLSHIPEHNPDRAIFNAYQRMREAYVNDCETRTDPYSEQHARAQQRFQETKEEFMQLFNLRVGYDRKQESERSSGLVSLYYELNNNLVDRRQIAEGRLKASLIRKNQMEYMVIGSQVAWMQRTADFFRPLLETAGVEIVHVDGNPTLKRAEPNTYTSGLLENFDADQIKQLRSLFKQLAVADMRRRTRLRFFQNNIDEDRARVAGLERDIAQILTPLLGFDFAEIQVLQKEADEIATTIPNVGRLLAEDARRNNTEQGDLLELLYSQAAEADNTLVEPINSAFKMLRASHRQLRQNTKTPDEFNSDLNTFQDSLNDLSGNNPKSEEYGLADIRYTQEEFEKRLDHFELAGLETTAAEFLKKTKVQKKYQEIRRNNMFAEATIYECMRQRSDIKFVKDPTSQTLALAKKGILERRKEPRIRVPIKVHLI